MARDERLAPRIRSVEEATDRLLEAVARGNPDDIAAAVEARAAATDELVRQFAALGASRGDPGLREARDRIERQAALAERELRRLSVDSRRALLALRQGSAAARGYLEGGISAVVLDRSG